MRKDLGAVKTDENSRCYVSMRFFLRQFGTEAEASETIKCEEYEFIIARIETDMKTAVARRAYNDGVVRRILLALFVTRSIWLVKYLKISD